MKKYFHHFSSLIFTQDINDGLNKLINSLKDVLPISQKVKKGKGLIFNVGPTCRPVYIESRVCVVKDVVKCSI